MDTHPEAGLKIISLNIEQEKHYDRILPFLKEQQPDIVLLQEVFAKDIPLIEKATGMKSAFAVLNTIRGIEDSQCGLLNLSSVAVIRSTSIYYRGDGLDPPVVGLEVGEGENIDRALLVTECVKGNQHYCVINTHFTWTADGHPSKKQYEDIEIMLQHLSKFPQFILAGDFNAPRGRPIFDKLASLYQDNIPVEITTTIDKNLHRAGDLNLVVDGMFTTPHYQVDSLQVISGLSDHCALLAKIIFRP